jgi:hypothetical protein
MNMDKQNVDGHVEHQSKVSAIVCGNVTGTVSIVIILPAGQLGNRASIPDGVSYIVLATVSRLTLWPKLPAF